MVYLYLETSTVTATRTRPHPLCHTLHELEYLQKKYSDQFEKDSNGQDAGSLSIMT